MPGRGLASRSSRARISCYVLCLFLLSLHGIQEIALASNNGKQNGHEVLVRKRRKKKVAVINCLCLVRSKYMTIRNPVKKYGDKTHDRTAVALRTEIAHAHVGM